MGQLERARQMGGTVGGEDGVQRALMPRKGRPPGQSEMTEGRGKEAWLPWAALPGKGEGARA